MQKAYQTKIRTAISLLAEKNLKIVFEIKLSNYEIHKILGISKKDKNLKEISQDMLLKRINENGCYTMRDDVNKLVGCIFMHKHIMGKIIIYERVTLWISRAYRGCDFGFLLMAKISAHYRDSYIISISCNGGVFKNNELLEMVPISLDQIPKFVIDILSQLGKIRGADYTYFVNPKLATWFAELKFLE